MENCYSVRNQIEQFIPDEIFRKKVIRSAGGLPFSRFYWNYLKCCLYRLLEPGSSFTEQALQVETRKLTKHIQC